MNKYTVYAAYRWEQPECIKMLFENEKDCLKWCNEQEDRFGCKSMFVEPDAGKFLTEYILRSKVR